MYNSKIVFFGASQYVLPILNVLDVALIVTTEHKSSDPVSTYAKEKNIPFLSVTTLFDDGIVNRIREVNAEVAILASFGIIVPDKVLQMFPKGILNIHPSLLPKYRGPTPVQEALLNGDTTTGVTIIKLDNEVDHGPILIQQTAAIYPNETADAAYIRLFSDGAGLLAANLPGYRKGEIQLTEQNHQDATFTPRLHRDSGYIDIQNSPTPKKIEQMIRAYHPWPGVWTKVSMPNNEEKRIKLLPERMIQMEGKKPMGLKDFYNGYPFLKTTMEKILNTK